MSFASGALFLQISMHSEQRVWNLQPLGGFAGEGMLPSKIIRSVFNSGSGIGIALKRAFV
jgi:hypothetical protein